MCIKMRIIKIGHCYKTQSNFYLYKGIFICNKILLITQLVTSGQMIKSRDLMILEGV